MRGRRDRGAEVVATAGLRSSRPRGWPTEGLAERTAELAERTAELAERTAELAERTAELAERTAELAEWTAGWPSARGPRFGGSSGTLGPTPAPDQARQQQRPGAG
jgi:hypothetical protein